MLRQLSLLILLACFCSLASAKDSDNAPGLKLLAKAPAFQLTDQNNKKRKLADLLRQGPVAIVFHRSAEW